MTIWDTPISTPYGYVPGYPLNGGFHKGIDYACPVGTDVTVNGVVIAKSGNTGYSTGPHCHVGHWSGRGVLDPGTLGGKTVSGAVVTQVAEDATNGKFIRVGCDDGTNFVYLHLSEQLVTVGQKLEGEIDMADIFNEGDRVNANNWLYGQDLGKHGDQVGKTYKDAMAGIFTSPDYATEHSLNDGDTQNLNNLLFGKDLNLFGSQVGKVWKDSVYGALGSDEFIHENTVNDGDITNLSVIPNVAQAKGKIWKDAVYSTILPNIPTGTTAPVPGTVVTPDSTPTPTTPDSITVTKDTLWARFIKFFIG